ncbi:cyclic AMP-responsive element-binding protein 3-like protein 4 [Bombina bombina]|uniref:cyclic AMP-responsive element-binding protein 3-like protein 4 n=1 Tax=Bombina bombina TaxID=8345 RepID=UPI00235A6F3E|nr:cyclic AMP-responsive element-binding protein 3-like protein 4 [Bombina bombina]XP_053560403.1 cyclic AMP-responsive element-binding protein 3-like protein 4 [Bombina bombina]XP_053560404.1 cyclic AMP-responsive element-binding protein 3-like protein 4 [Bombina bombina]XP_053560405.1 cyclic AMP-responsive element-binding protein 3-like protein 4 [Bombina bombina]
MDSSRPDLLLGSLFEQQELFHTDGFSGSDASTFPLSEAHGFPAEKLYDDWTMNEKTGLSEREDADEFLQMMINPNEVYSTGGTVTSSSPESDSGFSDDPQPDTPTQNETSTPLPQPTPVYELVYDVSSLDRRRVQSEMSSVISIQLAEDWTTPVVIPESCLLNEVPPIHTSALFKPAVLPVRMTSSDLLSVESLYPELHLTDEEKRLLTQEGVALPSNLPLTKAEERILKKVRRKIRNKQSAQDSRKRKKEYIDGLESRVAACSAQNQELHKKVVELEKHNVSLITQLRKLQTLIKQTSNKAAQTSTCVLILVFSLALLIFPSYSPLRSRSSLSDGSTYRPTGVISRNILNKVGSSEVLEPPGLDDTQYKPKPEEKTMENHDLPPTITDLKGADVDTEGVRLVQERQISEVRVPLEAEPRASSENGVLLAQEENSYSKDYSKTARADEM